MTCFRGFIFEQISRGGGNLHFGQEFSRPFFKCMTMNSDDLIFLQYQQSVNDFLWSNDLFQSFEICIGNILLSIQDKKITFQDSDEGIFCEDILKKILDESSAFLGTLKTGAFYGSFHHPRALIELYASAAYCFSEKGAEKDMLKRYISFTKVFFYQKLQTHKSFWGLSQEQMNDLKQKYSNLDSKTQKIFGLNPLKDKKTIKSWRGGASIEDLLNELPPIHGENFEKTCHFTHLSSLRNRSEMQSWGLPNYWEQMLIQTAKYAFDTYVLIREKDSINEDGKKIIDNCWSYVAPALLKRLPTLKEITPSPSTFSEKD